MQFFRLSSAIPRNTFTRYWVWLCMVILAVVVLLTFFPALQMGFWMDDYINVDMAGRFKGTDYWARVFDPRLQRLWYRPMVGIQWQFTYSLFGGNPTGYHLVQILYHLANVLLLYWVAVTGGIHRRASLVAALLYGTWAMHSMAVYWPSVHDPVASVFFLAALGSWIHYLRSHKLRYASFTGLAFLGAVMSKEVGATLPLYLLLVDRLIVRQPASLTTLFKRYLPFGVIIVLYAGMQYLVVSQSEFTQRIGYGAGTHIVTVFMHYLAYLAFPWQANQWARFVVLAAGTVCFFKILRQDRRIIFLAILIAVPTFIVSPIPEHLMNTRYLYVPVMASAMAFGLLFDWLVRILERFSHPLSRIVPACLLAFALWDNSTVVGNRIQDFAGFTRELRLKFRPIYQTFPTFAPDTHLYFLDLPFQSLDISGMMFLRYGTGVTVGGLDEPRPADLRGHNAAYVFYFDDQEQFRAQPVAPLAPFTFAPPLPVRFDDGISLIDIQVTSTQLKRGDVLVVLLNWTSQSRPSQNYTVFAHLVDADGHQVAGYDSQPQRGRAPTTTWLAKHPVADGIVIPIDDAVPPGAYTIHIGLYDKATMRRLALLDSQGQPIGDTVTFAPVYVSER